MMKMCTSIKVIRNFKMFMKCCLRIVANILKVAKSAIKKMKKIEEEHKSTLAQLKDAKF